MRHGGGEGGCERMEGGRRVWEGVRGWRGEGGCERMEGGRRV